MSISHALPQNKDPNLLTEDQLKRVLPPQMKKSVTPSLLKKVNQVINDPELAYSYRDNFIGYIDVMLSGKFKIDSYIDAVKYVSYKLMGNTNTVSYAKTFPDRYQKFVDNNVSVKDIATYVTMYNKNKLVNLIYEQTLIPTYVLNADLHQKALNVQAELMVSAKSEKVRTDAANSLLHHLKVPENTKIELDITTKTDSSIDALRESTMALVEQQKKMLQLGVMSAKDIADTKVIAEADYEEVKDG